MKHFFVPNISSHLLFKFCSKQSYYELLIFFMYEIYMSDCMQNFPIKRLSFSSFWKIIYLLTTNKIFQLNVLNTLIFRHFMVILALHANVSLHSWELYFIFGALYLIYDSLFATFTLTFALLFRMKWQIEIELRKFQHFEQRFHSSSTDLEHI